MGSLIEHVHHEARQHAADNVLGVEFRALYHKGKKGEIRRWKVWSLGDSVTTNYGVCPGEPQIASYKAEANSLRTAEQQAAFEAASKFLFKLQRKYALTPEEARDEELPLPMLAQPFSAKKAVWPSFVQPKFDGLRCLAERDEAGTGVVLTSRANKVFGKMRHIVAALEKWLPAGIVLDGELYCHGVPLQTSNSMVRQGDESIEYVVYDVVDRSQMDLPFINRWNDLSLFVSGIGPTSNVWYAPIEQVGNEDAAREWQACCVADGYEGAILRNPAGVYRFGYRSSDLMKLKSRQDAEFLVIGIEEGKGKMEGAAIFVCSCAGGEFAVVRAGTMDERREDWRNRNNLVGKYLTVEFETYSNAGIPLKPTGKAIRLEEDLL